MTMHQRPIEEVLLAAMRDNADKPQLQLEIIKSLYAEVREARRCARVLAHAHDYGGVPAPWALHLARDWAAQ